MADPCTDCPDYIKSAVREPVQIVLDQLLAVKKMTRVLKEVLETISSGVASAVAAIVDAIPDPPIFDLTEILDTLLCPMTPIALGLNATDLATLDPRELYTRVQGILLGHIGNITRDFLNALRQLEEFNVVEIGQRYFEELKRIQLDEVLFAKAVSVTALIKTICPEEFEEGPYEQFEEEATNFSLDDLIPTELGVDGKALMDELQRAENKFLGWRALATNPIPF